MTEFATTHPYLLFGMFIVACFTVMMSIALICQLVEKFIKKDNNEKTDNPNTDRANFGIDVN